MFNKFILSLSLLNLPLSSIGQTTYNIPRFYVGLGAALFTEQPFHPSSTLPALIGPTLVSGFQLTPRLALQTSVSAYHRVESTTAVVNSNSGGSTTYANQESANILALPILFRYTFAIPTPRIALAVLGGITLLRSNTHLIYSAKPLGQSTSWDEQDFVTNQTYFSLGPSVRYALERHLELSLLTPVNIVLANNYSGKFSDRLSLTLQANISYTFGQF